MRDIKFRAFITAQSRTGDVEAINFKNEYVFVSGVKWRFDEIELVQFIGETHQEAELWEGDIYEYAEAVADYHYVTIKKVAALDEDAITDLDWHSDIKIIGNIHQNPELLEVSA